LVLHLLAMNWLVVFPVDSRPRIGGGRRPQYSGGGDVVVDDEEAEIRRRIEDDRARIRSFNDRVHHFHDILNHDNDFDGESIDFSARNLDLIKRLTEEELDFDSELDGFRRLEAILDNRKNDGDGDDNDDENFVMLRLLNVIRKRIQDYQTLVDQVRVVKPVAPHHVKKELGTTTTTTTVTSSLTSTTSIITISVTSQPTTSPEQKRTYNNDERAGGLDHGFLTDLETTTKAMNRESGNFEDDMVKEQVVDEVDAKEEEGDGDDVMTSIEIGLIVVFGAIDLVLIAVCCAKRKRKRSSSRQSIFPIDMTLRSSAVQNGFHFRAFKNENEEDEDEAPGRDQQPRFFDEDLQHLQLIGVGRPNV